MESIGACLAIAESAEANGMKSAFMIARRRRLSPRTIGSVRPQPVLSAFFADTASR